MDRKNHYNIDALFDKIKMPSDFSKKSEGIRQSMSGMGFGKKNVENAKFHEIHDDKKPEVNTDQNRIDEILDKISKSGYQNLNDEEKRILFEASRKK